MSDLTIEKLIGPDIDGFRYIPPRGMDNLHATAHEYGAYLHIDGMVDEGRAFAAFAKDGKARIRELNGREAGEPVAVELRWYGEVYADDPFSDPAYYG